MPPPRRFPRALLGAMVNRPLWGHWGQPSGHGVFLEGVRPPGDRECQVRGRVVPAETSTLPLSVMHYVSRTWHFPLPELARRPSPMPDGSGIGAPSRGGTARFWVRVRTSPRTRPVGATGGRPADRRAPAAEAPRTEDALLHPGLIPPRTAAAGLVPAERRWGDPTEWCSSASSLRHAAHQAYRGSAGTSPAPAGSRRTKQTCLPSGPLACMRGPAL